MTNSVEGAVASDWSLDRSAAGGHNSYLIASVVSIATFMEVLDTTIANVAKIADPANVCGAADALATKMKALGSK